MKYRSEIDGLRALAVVPVVLYHAGLELFSGGFVGVDVFFVISGYLITTIIVHDLKNQTFSLAQFYERRARRILPALFLVVIACLPFAWFILMPRDMLLFSNSLLSVVTFTSNFFFWKHSGYFDVAAELNPLLHTWSLAVEEQYYIFFPLLMLLLWQFGRRLLLAACGLVFIGSLMFSEWAAANSPTAAFYLLSSRAWELLLGAAVGVLLLKENVPWRGGVQANLASLAGLLMLLLAVFGYDQHTRFPGFHALLPTLGTALVILYAVPGTLVWGLLSSRALVSTGLISYSLYLWHQPIFALARYVSPQEPALWLMLLLSLGSVPLAWLSWRYVESHFRQRQVVGRRRIFQLSLGASAAMILLGVAGKVTHGFVDRFDIAALPQPWASVRCHGAASLAELANPMAVCLGDGANHVSGDVFLLGDSHAAQLTFPLAALVKERRRELFFINTEARDQFPYLYWRQPIEGGDPVLTRVMANADAGDSIVIAFHRGRLNEKRDAHVSLSQPVEVNKKSELFLNNMRQILPNLLATGARVYLVKDGPLLAGTVSLERCARLRASGDNQHCSVSVEQDLHTRRRQDLVFDQLSEEFDGVEVLDIQPILYRGSSFFNPFDEQGNYRMFDLHHITEDTAMELLPYFDQAIPKSEA